MASKVPSISLNNGFKMPAFALGTVHANEDEMIQAAKDAIDAGYRHFDTAHVYQNEAALGRGLRAKIEEGVIKREDIFVTTKLWCTYFKPDQVIEACKRSNEAINLGYIDLYLMHTPVGMPLQSPEIFFPKKSDGTDGATWDNDFLDTYKKMEECVTLGLCKSIGVSNFNSEQLQRVVSNSKIKPVCNQVECSANINQRKLIDFCKKLDIIVTAYCPLGRPNREKCTPNFIFDSKVEAIGKKYNKTPAQIALRYCVELGTVPLPKSSNKARMIENINIFDFQLTPEEIKIMDGFHTGQRICAFTDYKDHKNWPFKIEF